MNPVDRFLSLAQSELEASGQLVAKSCVQAMRLGGLQFEALRSMIGTALSPETPVGTSGLQTTQRAAGSAPSIGEGPWQVAFELARTSARLAALQHAALGMAAADAMGAWSRASAWAVSCASRVTRRSTSGASTPPGAREPTGDELTSDELMSDE